MISKKFGTETKRATTSYTGDTTTVIPPTGGTATTTVVDALGRTVEVKQYTNAARTTSQSTVYAYNRLGQLAQVTDPANAQWTYTYDVRGRQVESKDPDKGVTKTAFDAGDRATDLTDARGTTLHTDYDDLGRPVATRQGTTTLTSMVYDTVAKGQLTKSTRFVDGKAFESEVLAYNNLYQPLTTKATIPSTTDTGALAGTYQWTNTYNIAGQLLTTKQPAMGDLPAETVGSTYKSVSGLLNNMAAGSSRLVSAMTYDHYGRSTRQELGALGQRVYRSTEYDEHTGAVTRAYTDRDLAPQRIEDTKYTNDPAGNLTSIATAYGQDAARTTDTQCVKLDALRRITQAWTNKGETCATTPSATVLGGEDPYWTTYTYDAVGNRKTETKHKTASGPTADTVRTYTPPTAGKHDLTKVTQTGTDPHDETFTYDESGNTRTRKSGTGDTQYLEWDVEGHLKSLTQGTSSDTFVYDTAGQRLLRKEAKSTTLYLPGGNELHLDKAGVVTGTRYYGDVAMREGGKLTFTIADHHGTGTVQIAADATQAVVRRKTGIFGEARGSQPTGWAGDKGFVGGTRDADSGLTHIGAREYDPLTGRFISVDPIMDLKDSQQLHGYTYSNQNPFTYWDPSGLALEECASGMYKCHNGNDPYDYGNRYETIVESVGGTLDPEYVRQRDRRGGSRDGGRLSSKGRATPKTPSENAPFRSKWHWYETYNLALATRVAEYDALTAGACAAHLDLTCELWNFYITGDGADRQVDVDDLLKTDPGFSAGKGVDSRSRGVDQVLHDWSVEARGKCGDVDSCSFSLDSQWIGTQFSGEDGAVAIGHAQMRIVGKMEVSGDGAGRKVTSEYTVELYKDWNFDKAKEAKGLSLKPFAEMHEYGLAREFAMVGKSSTQWKTL
ncbi:RHS repeat-associated core domain-containing protein [Streptomyces sp. NPDC006326]|uniref:RHS repeat domain-containing protein n=1 Tax=Streptomyces sp. NPDC006326 TaxID=3156752 RepID=UPI0033A31671